MRIALIILVVFYHAFAVYSGAWIRKFTPPHVNFYDWIDRLSYSCMLESFVFISGYIVGYQVVVKDRNIVLKKKFQRLMFPSIVFSILYYVFFGKDFTASLLLFYDILNGMGHLWFLPMLFWCFTFLKFFQSYSERYAWHILIVALGFVVVSLVTIPMRFNLALYYFPFFYIGYLIWIKNWHSKRISKVQLFFVILIFLIIFVGYTLYCKHLHENINVSLAMKSMNMFILFSGRYICSSLGVYIIFQIMLRIRDKGMELSSKWIRLSECCFGVYLLQQFFLIYMYDNTPMPNTLNAYLLPWIAFFLTLLLSLLGAWLIRQNSIGKKFV